MSIFGKWKCPNCGSTWTGSIGWDWSLIEPENKDKLDCLLQSMCGCEKVDDPIYPTLSASVTGFQSSEKRKLLQEKEE